MTSDKRIAANRRNALRSTGPRTQDGKSRSRLNAVKHGLAASLPALVETPSSARLARLLAPDAADEAATGAAARLAAAEAMIERCRHARADLAGGIIADETAGATATTSAAASETTRIREKGIRAARRIPAG